MSRRITLRWLEWLARTVETYGWRLHAFCLMNNHAHLFVETPRANLSAGMQHLNGSYTSYFNRRHRRVGHLFQGRFKAQVIDNEGYYWEISRYIHLNPVRAGLAKVPENWRWSSYAGYDRASRQLPWVEYNRVLREFGRRDCWPIAAGNWNRPGACASRRTSGRDGACSPGRRPKALLNRKAELSH